MIKWQTELKTAVKIISNERKFGRSITPAETKMETLLNKLREEIEANFSDLSEPGFGKNLMDFIKNSIAYSVLVGAQRKESSVTEIGDYKFKNLLKILFRHENLPPPLH